MAEVSKAEAARVSNQINIVQRVQKRLVAIMQRVMQVAPSAGGGDRRYTIPGGRVGEQVAPLTRAVLCSQHAPVFTQRGAYCANCFSFQEGGLRLVRAWLTTQCRGFAPEQVFAHAHVKTNEE